MPPVTLAGDVLGGFRTERRYWNIEEGALEALGAVFGVPLLVKLVVVRCE